MKFLDRILGRPLKTSEAGDETIGPIAGVAVLGLDGLSSAGYGPEAAIAVLMAAGAAGLPGVGPIMIGITALLTVLAISYWQTITAYPDGGGSYTVAKQNLGIHAGVCASAALALDYLLTAAVGISAGVGALESAIPALQAHRLSACLIILALITFLNLRGIRESGGALMLPTYAFVVTLAACLVLGLFKSILSGGHPAAVVAPTAMPPAAANPGLWLLIRAFASGCTAMTGVEAVSNGVPLFSEPRAKKAHATLAIIVAVLAILLIGIAWLARAYRIGVLDQNDPHYQSVISQLAAAVAGRGVFYYVTLFSVLIVLTLSANTSFAGFPRLCRLLADDGFLPMAFADLGRRLVYTAGITVLALLSGILLIAFDGVTDRLIPLYAVGAFAAFTLSQAGMVMHWRKQKGNRPCQFINGFGALATGSALVVIVAAKFMEGAWVSILAIGAFYLLFLGVHRHYQKIGDEIADDECLPMAKADPLLVVVPMRNWNKVTKQALRFAMDISPDVVGLHIRENDDDERLRKRWSEWVEEPARVAGLTPPRLEVITSEYRRLIRPIIEFVDKVHRSHPGRLIAVVIPELVQPRWYEAILHNHYAAILKAMLLLNGKNRVVTVSVPWYLRDSEEELVKRDGIRG